MAWHQGSGPGWSARRENAWIDLQPMLDRLFLPFEQMLADAVMAEEPGRVLDIGCGTGATTLAVARRLAPHGDCTGIDVSRPMLNQARQRAAMEGSAKTTFIAGDAQRHRFTPDTYDAAVSRFGVMFFDDPAAAFTNIGHAIRPDGALTCMVWRSGEENPFMTAAERATRQLLGWSDQPDPEVPGQFAFADAARVSRLLAAAGWRDIRITPVDITCTLSQADFALYMHRMGRVGVILPDLDYALRKQVAIALDKAFAEFLVDGIAEFNAACWMIRAHAG